MANEILCELLLFTGLILANGGHAIQLFGQEICELLFRRSNKIIQMACRILCELPAFNELIHSHVMWDIVCHFAVQNWRTCLQLTLSAWDVPMQGYNILHTSKEWVFFLQGLPISQRVHELMVSILL